MRSPVRRAVSPPVGCCLMAAACAVLLLLVATQPAWCQQDQAASPPPVDASDGQLQQQQQRAGIFNMLFSPLRATMQRARRLLGHRLEGARELAAAGFSQLQTRTFNMFASLHNKTYSADEIPRRMALFFERRKLIEQSVRDFAAGKLPFTMRENAFLDWDELELRALAGASPPRSLAEMTPEERAAVTELRHQGAGNATGPPTPSPPLVVARARSLNSAMGANDVELDAGLVVGASERIPASKDWRASGCVSAPINQLKCGACYAIATMGAVETQRCLNQVSSPTLSPQQIVDCATPRAGYQNFGCDGGWPTRVLKYLQAAGVAARESCYPFVRRQLQCRLASVRAVPGCTVPASPSNTSLRYRVLNNERDILYHVAKTGPVITVMQATDKFLYYGSGIFDDPKCSRRRDDVDHAIVIAGYGRESGQDYWLIKNSWGTTDWGENGYAKYKRGTNACSIGHWGWVITG